MRTPILVRVMVLLGLVSSLVGGTVYAATGVSPGHEATVISADGLNVRSEPRPTADVVAVADDGDFVNVLDGPTSQGSDEWYRVEYEGTVGWVAGSFLGPPRDRATVSTRGGVRADQPADRITLPVPYYSQFDGSPYQAGNCGPSTLHMVLAAFGKNVPVSEIRRAANQIQGTTGWYSSGVAIDVLAGLAGDYGLVVRGLRGDGGYDRWSFDEVRQALRNGNVVVPQVHYASLPGHGGASRAIDHYIAITGYEGRYFYYNDPAFSGGGGHGLAMTEDQLALAWKRSDFPFAAFSLGPGPGMAPLIAPARPPAAPPAASPPEPAIDVAIAAAKAEDSTLIADAPAIPPVARRPVAEPDQIDRVAMPTAPPAAVQTIADAVSTTYDATVSAGVDHVSAGIERISETANGPQLWTTLALAAGLALLGARRQLARLSIWQRRRRWGRRRVSAAGPHLRDGQLVREPVAA
jgi:uncharacterized protein YgiM (DUF1202 family)